MSNLTLWGFIAIMVFQVGELTLTKRRDKMVRRVTPTTKDEKAEKRAAKNAHYKEMYQKLKRTRTAKGEKK
mgnify:FL=1